jgi:hypothetical protein
MEQYRKMSMFEGDEEWISSRDVVGEMIEEYQAAERDDYLGGGATANPIGTAV